MNKNIAQLLMLLALTIALLQYNNTIEAQTSINYCHDAAKVQEIVNKHINIEVQSGSIPNWRDSQSGPPIPYYNLKGDIVVYLVPVIDGLKPRGYVVVQRKDCVVVEYAETAPISYATSISQARFIADSLDYELDEQHPIYIGPFNQYLALEPKQSLPPRGTLDKVLFDMLNHQVFTLREEHLSDSLVSNELHASVVFPLSDSCDDHEVFTATHTIPTVTSSKKIIGNVPTYLQFCYKGCKVGCSPNAGGTIMGYWANHGFPNLMPDSYQNTIKGLNDRAGTWCCGGSSSCGNPGLGCTWWNDLTPAMEDFASDQGYSGFDSTYTRSPSFSAYQTEIANNRPVVASFNGYDGGAWNGSNHATTGVGYDTAAGQFMIVVPNIYGHQSPVYVNYNSDYSTFHMNTLIPPDIEPPSTTITTGPSGWIDNNSATFEWTGSDNQTLPENLVYSYKLDSPSWSSWTSSTSKTYSNLSEGTHTFEVKAKDQAGNEEHSPATRTFNVDTVDPSFSFNMPVEEQWYNTDRTITWNIAESGSGLDYSKWGWDDSSPDAPGDGTSGSTQLSVPGQGKHTLYVQAWDVAGNDALASKGWFGYDTADPDAPVISPGCTASDNQWQNTCRDPVFTWRAIDPNDDDGSGIDQYAYAWNTSASDDPTNWGNTTTYDPGPITTENGVAQHYLHAKARDVAGNDSPVNTFGLWYDGSAPTASMLINGGASTTNQVSVRIALTADDTGSGVSQMRFSHNGLYWTDWQPVVAVSDWALPALDRRELPVYAQVRDGAGNLSTVVSDTIVLDLYPVMPHSANYRICNDVIDAGGSISLSSASYTLISAIGQPLASGGQAGTSATFAQHAGFLADLDGCRPISHTVTDNLDLHRWVIASGGNLRSSSSYRLGDTTGQPAASGANAFRSASYVLSSGFWGDTVPPSPVAPTRLQVSGPSTGQTGVDYTFTANVNFTATTPLTYAWNHAGTVVVHGERGLSDAFQASWSQTGAHQIVVTATNAAGATQQTHFITLQEPQPTCLNPLAAVSIDAPVTGLVGLPYDFTAILTPTDATLPITYTWSPEPESGQGTSQATYRWNSSGEQAVTLVVNQCGGDFNAYHSSIYDSSDRYIYLPLVLKMQ